MVKNSKVVFALLGMLVWLIGTQVQAAEKPNILVIWGDDVGYWNLSHINHDFIPNRIKI